MKRNVNTPPVCLSRDPETALQSLFKCHLDMILSLVLSVGS